MAQSITSMGDWIPNGVPASEDFGAFTGFGTFSVDPESSGVVDSRGAFNPVFNGRTSKPMFEAETDSLRSALPGLARKAQSGDAVAAMNYDTLYRTFRDRKGIYDIAAAVGLNDRNAAFIMNHTFDAVTQQSFGGGTSAFRGRYARYLANLTKDRNTNAERLIEGDQRLDNAFRSSFLSSLETAGDVFRPSSSVRNQYNGNDAAVAVEALRVKEALSAWEKANGYRTDDERESIMSAAASYYAKCKANPGLRPLASNPLAIISAAASKAGVPGSGTKDVFKDYDDALTVLDRRLSYTGSAAEDLARGFSNENQTLAFAAVKDAYQQIYGRNLAAGRSAEDGLRDNGDLHALLVANLKRVNPQVASTEAGMNMVSDLATNIMNQMADTGSVNFMKATMMYLNPDFQNMQKYVAGPRMFAPEVAKGFSVAVDQLVTDVLQNRDSFRQGSPGPIVGSGLLTSPYYDKDAIGKTVSAEFDRLVASNDSVREFAKNNPVLVDRFKAIFTDYLFNANTVADPVSIWENIENSLGAAGEDLGYRTGAQDVMQALVLGAELEKLGYDLKGWNPKVTGEDRFVRGRGKENFRNLYGGLAEVLKDQIVMDPKDDAEFYKMQVGQRTVDSIRNLIDQINADSQGLLRSAKDRVDAEFKNRLGRLAGNLVSESFSQADTAMNIRYAEALKAASVPRPGVDPARAQALREYSEGVFSDQLNPALVRNLRSYAVNKLGGMTGLTKDMQAYYADAYLPGLVTMAKIAFRDNPVMSAAYSSDRIALQRMLDARSSALFADAQAQSDLLLKQKNDAILKQYSQKLDIKETK